LKYWSGLGGSEETDGFPPHFMSLSLSLSPLLTCSVSLKEFACLPSSFVDPQYACFHKHSFTQMQVLLHTNVFTHFLFSFHRLSSNFCPNIPPASFQRISFQPRLYLDRTRFRLLSILHLPRPHLTSIDWRFVRAVRPDDSAVAPSAPSPLRLQDKTRSGDGGYP
jgi:hypothetical protein